MKIIHSFIDVLTKRKVEIYKDGRFTGIRVHKTKEELNRRNKMKKKVIWIIIGLLLIGPYIGIDVQEICNGPFLQKTIRVAIEKPFLNHYTYGYWNFYIGIGPKEENKSCQYRYGWFLEYNYELRGIWITP